MRSAFVSGLFVIVVSGVSLPRVIAQHGDTVSPTFHGGIDLVVMDIVVANGQRVPVPGLTEDDFSVFEDGMPQHVSFFAAHHVPLDTALVFDTSGSMEGELPAVRSCGTGFSESLGERDRASVVELKERINILQPLTSARQDLAAAMTHLTEGGETGLYDGLYVALSQLRSRSRTEGEIRSGALVVITDGADTVSLVTFDQLLEQARRQAIAIYVVRLQSKELSRELSKQEIVGVHRAMDILAAETGGRVLSEQHGDLASLCGTIAQELAERYTVGYYSANTSHDGGYRRISVRLDGHPELTARTRAGYVSK